MEIHVKPAAYLRDPLSPTAGVDNKARRRRGGLKSKHMINVPPQFTLTRTAARH
jgi:hypothetical protein